MVVLEVVAGSEVPGGEGFGRKQRRASCQPLHFPRCYGPFGDHSEQTWRSFSSMSAVMSVQNLLDLQEPAAAAGQSGFSLSPAHAQERYMDVTRGFGVDRREEIFTYVARRIRQSDNSDRNYEMYARFFVSTRDREQREPDLRGSGMRHDSTRSWACMKTCNGRALSRARPRRRSRHFDARRKGRVILVQICILTCRRTCRTGRPG